MSKLMEGINASWVLALVLAVPIAISANLLTPVVQRYLGSRNERQREKQAQRLAIRRARVRRLIDRGATPVEIALDALLAAGWVGGLTGIVASMSSAAVAIIYMQDALLARIIEFSGLFIAAVGGLIVINILSKAMDTINDVRSPELLDADSGSTSAMRPDQSIVADDQPS